MAEGSQVDSSSAEVSLSSGSVRSSSGSRLQEELVREYREHLRKPAPSSPLYLPRTHSSPYAGKTSGRSVITPDCCPTAASYQQLGLSVDEWRTSENAERGRDTLHMKGQASSEPAPQCRRPHNAAASQLRRSLKSPGRPPVCQRQPQIIRVIDKNGSREIFTTVTASNFTLLLEECTSKLRLNSAARRIFLADGAEARAPEDIPKDADVYVSAGEAFVDPLREVRAHLSVCKESGWTLAGVALPEDGERGRTRTSLSPRLRHLCQPAPAARVLLFRNGTGRGSCEVSSSTHCMEQFLDLCTEKLRLTSKAKAAYDWDGRCVEDISQVSLLDGCLQTSISPLRGPVWASRGEAFGPEGVSLYVKGVLQALRGRLLASDEHLRQLDWALEKKSENVTRKEILSLTRKQLRDARGKVQKQAGELKDCVRRHQQQLSVLALLLQAAEAQSTSPIWPLSHGPPLPKGLQLKVYQNGLGAGASLVLINRAELDKGCDGDQEHVMDHLLQIIHRRLGSRARCSPSGPRLGPTCLYDEQGEVIRSPLHLQSEQSVWLSYGERDRTPSTSVLWLLLERATAAGGRDDQAVCRTALHPDTVLPAGFKRWEVVEGFPSDCTSSPSEAFSLKPTVDINAHFLQLKEAPGLVLYPSAVVVKKARTAGHRAQESAAFQGCSSAHLWVITKTGEILSHAFPQLCLAVSSSAVKLKAHDGSQTEAHTLNIQKRTKGCPLQQWRFGKDGSISPEAVPAFSLTYLEDWPSTPEVSKCDVNHTNQAPDSLWGEAQASGDRAQLSVALLRQHKGKQPQASAQRWAIKPEGSRRVDQLRQSKVENPMWSRLNYTWPTLPSGELNEELTWPLEGALIPRAPPLTHSRGHHSPTALRLRVLRNGQWGEDVKPITVTVPNLTTSRMATRRKSQKQQADSGTQESNNCTVIQRLEFQEFLDSCTESLNLHFAARRLFHKDGKEIFILKDVLRDQLVYVSCGEQWVDPHLSRTEAKKRLQLVHLERDVSQIRHYCALRNHHDLVLDVKGELQEGAPLIARHCCVTSEEGASEENPEAAHQDDISDLLHDLRDSHWRAHQRIDEKPTKFRYPWQGNDENIMEDIMPCDEGSAPASTHRHDKHRPEQQRGTRAHRQQFEFSKGQIVSCRRRWLAVGVGVGQGASGARAGSPVQLLHRNTSDPHQHWTLREGARTLHLLAEPGLVLSVSMPQLSATDSPSTPALLSGRPVVLQKYRAYSYGAANQKWGWLSEHSVLSAFYTESVDQDVTAAQLASVCTGCVSTEPLHQQGYCFTGAGETVRAEVCVSCATALRGRGVLQLLPPGSTFICSTSQLEQQLSPHGPFRSLVVHETELGARRADDTLQRLEDRLERLRREAAVQTPSLESCAARAQPAVKIVAHRNSQGLEEGQLITAASMPLLLSECTRRLKLPRAALHLYTADGTQILTLPQLKAWAVNHCLHEHCSSTDSTNTDTNATETDHAEHTGEHTGEDPEEIERLGPVKEQLQLRVSAEDLCTVEPGLLELILRKPIHVWLSCGEPFLPSDVVARRERQKAAQWLKKEKLLVDLEIKRHKMRHLKGRRISRTTPATLVPTQSPLQPVVVVQGWLQPTQEELTLSQELLHSETCLAEVEAMLGNDHRPLKNTSQDVYHQPNVKRVQMYQNGDMKASVYVWGESIEELLSCSSVRLGLSRAASRLYTAQGRPLCSWADIHRDMLVCVSTGEPFITPKGCKDKIEMRASFARVMRCRRLDATRRETTAVELGDACAQVSCSSLPGTVAAETPGNRKTEKKTLWSFFFLSFEE